MNGSGLASTTIGIIGTGVMAESILAGILHEGMSHPEHITCSHPRAERREALHQMYRVTTVSENADAADAQVVVLAVKPQMLPRVMPELSGKLDSDSLVLSVVAGAPVRALQSGLQHRLVVRAMPNTPAQIGAGVTVWYAATDVDSSHRALTKSILATLGAELEVNDEDDVAKATAVSGTGPTYVFLFIEAMIDAAVHMGFPRHLARELVLDTVKGSAAFAEQSGRHAAELRDMVTSPGGTSAAALYELERGRFRTVLSDAMWASYRRTTELEERIAGASAQDDPLAESSR
jgi:pyrroline-5-carboxylate reductase